MSTQPQLKIEKSIESKGSSTSDKLKNTETDEIFIGICSPIGSLKDEVICTLKYVLEKKYNYEVKIIKKSELILKYGTDEIKYQTKKSESYSKLIHKINEGDQLRNKFGNSVLADLAIKNIHEERLNSFENSGVPPKSNDIKSRRICYIIDSLKSNDELNLFRKVYRSLFYQISIFSPEDKRKLNLTNKGLTNSEINELISKDEYENLDYGQNVRNTFINADYFFRISHTENLNGKIEKIALASTSDDEIHNLHVEIEKSNLYTKVFRFLNLIFDSSVITPLPHEYAMYLAKSAAANSACLSRQVGAAITDKSGEIISKGWNDVPKFGGNLYNSNDREDKRCFNLGYCSNDITKDSISEDILKYILEDEKLNSEIKDKLKDLSTQRTLIKRLRSSKIKDLLEFSRSVHAEMHAIITGSQLSGKQMIGGKLFCTTYPCHNCARHIIVAGIKEVYYIEPYVKSLGTKLHDDSITEDENDSQKVRILIYDGIAPRRYLEFFDQIKERKNKKGKYITPELSKVSPKTRLTLQALNTLEEQATHSLNEKDFFDKK